MSFAGRRRGNKVKKGVQFTVMVVGESIPHPFFRLLADQLSMCRTYFALAGASGTGRTTFVNTLCESEVLAHKISDNPETAHVEEGIRIKPANVGALMLATHPYICILSSNMLQNWRKMVSASRLLLWIPRASVTTLTTSSRKTL
jgi:hypothetical protein